MTTSHEAVVALAMLILTVALAGWGFLFRGLFHLGTVDSRSVIQAPLIGWCLVIAILQLWHLFLPVDGRIASLVLAVGIAGLVMHAQGLRAWLSGSTGRVAGFIMVMGGAALWLAGQTTTQPALYDSGLYHLQAIQRAGAYPAVPGLGNLHGRFAFNSSFFLYAAMLNAGPFVNRAHHLATGANHDR